MPAREAAAAADKRLFRHLTAIHDTLRRLSTATHYKRNKNTGVRAFTLMFTDIYIYVYMHVFFLVPHALTYTNTHIHTHSHTHTHTCVCCWCWRVTFKAPIPPPRCCWPVGRKGACVCVCVCGSKGASPKRPPPAAPWASTPCTPMPARCWRPCGAAPGIFMNWFKCSCVGGRWLSHGSSLPLSPLSLPPATAPCCGWPEKAAKAAAAGGPMPPPNPAKPPKPENPPKPAKAAPLKGCCPANLSKLHGLCKSANRESQRRIKIYIIDTYICICTSIVIYILMYRCTSTIRYLHRCAHEYINNTWICE